MHSPSRVEMSMYALYNYRKIYKDFLNMKRGSIDYENTRIFLEKVNMAVELLKNSPTVDAISKPISREYTGSIRALYYDILYLSFLVPESYNSEQIIEKIKEKYNFSITVVKLSKLKRKAAIALSPFLESTIKGKKSVF